MDNEQQKALDRKNSWHTQYDYMVANKKWSPDIIVWCDYCREMLDGNPVGRWCIDNCPFQSSCWKFLRMKIDYPDLTQELPQDMLDECALILAELDQEYEATYG